jgi:hypothetical protein
MGSRSSKGQQELGMMALGVVAISALSYYFYKRIKRGLVQIKDDVDITSNSFTEDKIIVRN